MKLTGAKLGNEGAEDLAGGLDKAALPALQVMWVDGNNIGERGMAALCDMFRRGAVPKLKTFYAGGNELGNAGAATLATALETGGVPEYLQSIMIVLNDIGDEGATALATALLRSGRGVTLPCAQNRIGLAGQSALLKALEARGDTSFVERMSVFLMNPPLWPLRLNRAQKMAWVSYTESGIHFAL